MTTAPSSAESPTASAAAHAAIICTVDVVLLTLRDHALHVVLLKRRGEPHAGVPALPGGYIHPQEDATAWDAAARMLREKTGIVSPYLEQLATYSGRQRDPRGWSLSVVYYALVPDALVPDDGEGLSVVPVADLPQLPFDHAEIVQLAVSRVRAKSQYSSLPVYLCGERITLPQLQAVYEAVLGEPINKVSFRRKVEELGMLEPVEGELLTGAAHRPAQVYRLRPAFRRELSTVQRGLNA
ncbi:Bifunctional NMN adenylyltransferase/Nudix hydrolase [Bordetella ansorpii]|uniref:Bifunctional NMN adenylyltransferase/Nudix hydrolase n=1 Tax=Bordetella ansorpii TaxID=288768 RepID=A0A157NG23_9BORD|nr:NUDIX domain-containing protein [Bordetella ansorpii]SAI19974.1 Bifunctional NMN adenylyltransferase/Nudix hydrolase [Bordetella ansorpii]